MTVSENPNAETAVSEVQESNMKDFNSIILDKIVDILSNFDYEKVHSIMDFLDWEWVGVGVPDVLTLKKKSGELIKEAFEGLKEGGFPKDSPYSSATGGFMATVTRRDDDLVVLLEFIVEEIES